MQDKDRSICHVAIAAIYQTTESGQEKIFLQRRLSEPQKGRWELPGGKIEKDEKGDEALLRELEEELSLKISIDQLKFYGCYQHELYGKKTKLWVYCLKGPFAEIPSTWFPLEQCGSEDFNLINGSQIVIQDLLERGINPCKT